MVELSIFSCLGDPLFHPSRAWLMLISFGKLEAPSGSETQKFQLYNFDSTSQLNALIFVAQTGRAGDKDEQRTSY